MQLEHPIHCGYVGNLPMGASVQLESSHVFRCPLHEQKPWPNLSILAHGSYFTFDDSILFPPSQVGF